MFATRTSDQLPIVTGLLFFIVLRYSVELGTHRLRLEPDAVVLISYFGRRRIPYADIRAIRPWESSFNRKRAFVTLVTARRDIHLSDAYPEFPEIIEAIRQRCPQAKIQDTPDPD